MQGSVSWGCRFRIQSVGFRVHGVGFRVSWYRVPFLGFVGFGLRV